MIRALVRLFEWLDKRFPPKVTVTKESFEALIEREHQRNRGMSTLRLAADTLQERIKSLEASMAALKDLLAKGGAVGPAKEQRRADFIASGRMGE